MVTKKKTAQNQLRNAASIVTAAAGLATSVIADAASSATATLAAAAKDATTALAASAADAAKVVQESTAKALLEFPDIKTDIREIRNACAETKENSKAGDLRLTTINTSVEEINKHLKTQNGRLAKAEAHIIRQNLVVFGIAGPVSLLVIGYFVRSFFTTVMQMIN